MSQSQNDLLMEQIRQVAREMAESVKQNQKSGLKNIISNVLSDSPDDEDHRLEWKYNNLNETKTIKNSYFDSPKKTAGNNSPDRSPKKLGTSITPDKKVKRSSPSPQRYQQPINSSTKLKNGKGVDNTSNLNMKPSVKSIHSANNNSFTITKAVNKESSSQSARNNPDPFPTPSNPSNPPTTTNPNLPNNNILSSLRKAQNLYNNSKAIGIDNDNDNSIMDIDSNKNKREHYIPKDFYERELQLQNEKNTRLELARQKKEREDELKFDYNPKISKTSRQIINEKFSDIKPIYERANEILDAKAQSIVAKKRELIQKTESDIEPSVIGSGLKYDYNRFNNWRDEHMKWHLSVVEKSKRIKVENQIFEEQHMITTKPTINKKSEMLVKNRNKHSMHYVEHERHNLLYKDHEERQLKNKKLVKENTPDFTAIINKNLPKYLLNKQSNTNQLNKGKMNSDSKLNSYVNTFEITNSGAGLNGLKSVKNVANGPNYTKIDLNLHDIKRFDKKLTPHIIPKAHVKSSKKGFNRSMDEILEEPHPKRTLDHSHDTHSQRLETKTKINNKQAISNKNHLSGNRDLNDEQITFLDNVSPDFNDEYFKKDSCYTDNKGSKLNRNNRSASVAIVEEFSEKKLNEDDIELQNKQLIEEYKKKLFSGDQDQIKNKPNEPNNEKEFNFKSIKKLLGSKGRTKSLMSQDRISNIQQIPNLTNISAIENDTFSKKSLYKINLRNGTTMDRQMENSFVLTSDMNNIISKSKVDYEFVKSSNR